mmetsp:Transcript_512/g.740  ORF Transcript_512/g.740 Transcript_512/m.740 type:complete len:85 (-) Transcript_512:1876-2130(-)
MPLLTARRDREHVGAGDAEAAFNLDREPAAVVRERIVVGVILRFLRWSFEALSCVAIGVQTAWLTREEEGDGVPLLITTGSVVA